MCKDSRFHSNPESSPGFITSHTNTHIHTNTNTHTHTNICIYIRMGGNVPGTPVLAEKVFLKLKMIFLFLQKVANKQKS